MHIQNVIIVFFMVKFPDPTIDFNRTGRLYFNQSEINTESHFERLSAFVCNKQQEKRGRPWFSDHDGEIYNFENSLW